MQLDELLAAKRSPSAAEEDEDRVFLAAEILEPVEIALEGSQREGGGLVADLDSVGVLRRGGSRGAARTSDGGEEYQEQEKRKDQA